MDQEQELQQLRARVAELEAENRSLEAAWLAPERSEGHYKAIAKALEDQHKTDAVYFGMDIHRDEQGRVTSLGQVILGSRIYGESAFFHKIVAASGPIYHEVFNHTEGYAALREEFNQELSFLLAVLVTYCQKEDVLAEAEQFHQEHPELLRAEAYERVKLLLVQSYQKSQA